MEALNTILLILILLILIYCMFKVKIKTRENFFKKKGSYYPGTKVRLHKPGMGHEWKESEFAKQKKLHPVRVVKSGPKYPHKTISKPKSKSCFCTNGTAVSDVICPGKGLEQCRKCNTNYRLANVCLQN